MCKIAKSYIKNMRSGTMIPLMGYDTKTPNMIYLVMPGNHNSYATRTVDDFNGMTDIHYHLANSFD